MKSWLYWSLAAVLALAFAPAAAQEATDAQARPAGVAEDGEIDWLALMPPEDIKALEAMPEIEHDGSGPQVSFTSEKVVEAMNGVKGKLAGYIVPLEADAEGRMVDFFLVPYFGACIHMPPPPPNQIIYVKPKQPVPMTEIWDAYWIHGTLRVARQQNDVAVAVYSMELDRIERVE